MDGSWIKDGCSAAGGWAWQEGNLQFSGIAIPTLAISPLHVEILAVPHALLWAIHNAWDKVECLMDSTRLIDLLNTS